eukprot:4165623-Pyramimonas_sp.AAC.1
MPSGERLSSMSRSRCPLQLTLGLKEVKFLRVITIKILPYLMQSACAGPSSYGWSQRSAVFESPARLTSTRCGCCGVPGTTTAGCSCTGGRSHQCQ